MLLCSAFRLLCVVLIKHVAQSAALSRTSESTSLPNSNELRYGEHLKTIFCSENFESCLTSDDKGQKHIFSLFGHVNIDSNTKLLDLSENGEYLLMSNQFNEIFLSQLTGLGSMSEKAIYKHSSEIKKMKLCSERVVLLDYNGVISVIGSHSHLDQSFIPTTVSNINFVDFTTISKSNIICGISSEANKNILYTESLDFLLFKESTYDLSNYPYDTHNNDNYHHSFFDIRLLQWSSIECLYGMCFAATKDGYIFKSYDQCKSWKWFDTIANIEIASIHLSYDRTELVVEATNKGHDCSILLSKDTHPLRLKPQHFDNTVSCNSTIGHVGPEVKERVVGSRQHVLAGEPTSQPSRQPSRQPTSQPSRRPTVQPTTQPTRQPTAQPTTQPSRQPTIQPTTHPSIVSYGYSIISYSGTLQGYSGDEGYVSSAQQGFPKLSADSTDNVYITDSYYHIVRKVSATTQIISLFAGIANSTGFSGDSGPSTSAKLKYPANSWVDSTGTNVFIGDTYNCRIRLVSSGIITTYVGTGSPTSGGGDGGQRTAATIFFPDCVWGDSVSKLYICEGNRVRVVERTTGIITTLIGNGAQSNNGDNGPATSASITPVSIWINKAGAIYISAWQGNRIRKIENGIVYNFAGTGSFASNGDGGDATSASMKWVSCITGDQWNNIYLCDYYGYRVRKIDAYTNIISTIAGTGTLDMTGDGGFATNAALGYPKSLLPLLSDQSILVSFDRNSKIRKLSLLKPTSQPSSQPSNHPTMQPSRQPTSQPSSHPTITEYGYMLSTYGGSGTVGNTGDGGSVLAAKFDRLQMSTDSVGNIYIVDTAYCVARKVTYSTKIIQTFAGTSSCGYSSDNIAAVSSKLNNPVNAWTDSTGLSVFISDTDNHRIRLVANGIITTYAGTGTGSSTGDGGPVALATIINPNYVWGDSVDKLYISENNRIRVVNRVSGIISTLIGNGAASNTGDNALAVSATIFSAYSMWVSNSGYVYIASYQGNIIRRVDTVSGIVTTIAGTGVASSTGDGGDASSATINNPRSISGDQWGNLFITEYSGNRVRRIEAFTNIITTLIGTGQSTSSNDNILAFSAHISYPMSVCLSPTGENIYVYEYGSYKIRMLSMLKPTSLPSNQPTRQPSSQPSSHPTIFANSYSILSYAGDGTYGSTGDNGAMTSAKLGDIGGIVGDSMGNVYISLNNGGCAIRKLTKTTSIITRLAGIYGTCGYNNDNVQATSSNLNEPGGIWIDSAANLVIGDSNNHRVRRVSTSGIITTIAGNGVGTSSSGDGGVATSATIGNPSCVWGNSVSTLYICEYAFNRVRSVNVATNIIATLIGNGLATNNGDNGFASSTSASIATPVSIWVNNAGVVFIATQNVIRRIRSDNIVEIFAGTGSASSIGNGVDATSASINTASCVTGDAWGNIFICDNLGHKIRQIDPTNIITTIAGAGASSYSGDGGAALSAGIPNPRAFYLDSFLNGYLVEDFVYRIRKLSILRPTSQPSRQPTRQPSSQPSTHPTFFNYGYQYIIKNYGGTGSYGSNGDGGSVLSATVANSKISGDSVGNLYLADEYNMIVRKVAASTKIITTVAGVRSSTAYNGDNIAATSANMHLNYWGNAWVDSTGLSLFITDGGNNRIRLVVNGIITTYVGTGTGSSTGDGGQRTSATVSNPNYVWGDSVDKLYISENNRIRVVNRVSGIISTFTSISGSGIWVSLDGSVYISSFSGKNIRRVDVHGISANYAGNGASSGSLGDGGDATNAVISEPRCIGGDSLGNVYVCDTNVHRVRKIEAYTGIITTFAGNGVASSTGDNGPATSAAVYYPLSVFMFNTHEMIIFENSYKIRRVLAAKPTSQPSSQPSRRPSQQPSRQPSRRPTSQPSRIPSMQPTSQPSLQPSSNPTVATNEYAYSIVSYLGDGVCSSTGDNGPASLAKLGELGGIMADSAGNLYITMTHPYCTVRKVTAATNIISRFAGVTGQCSYNGNSVPTSAYLNTPKNVWIDSTGLTIFISDSLNHRIQMVNSGSMSNIVGTGTATSTGDGSSSLVATINEPWYVWGNSVYTLYVCEGIGNRVRQVNRNTNIITTLLGTGASTNLGDGGQVSLATIQSPSSLWVSKSGVIYVSSFNGHVVRKVSINGIITKFAGNGTNGNSVTSSSGIEATAAMISSPMCISGDLWGNVYICEYNSHRIRRVNAHVNILVTIAGSGASTYSGEGGLALNAGLPFPRSVFVTTDSNVYVANTGQCRIRSLGYLVPTSQPTLQPLAEPTAQPSSSPSLFPSGQPTTQPFTSPTTIPSTIPSIIPSSLPSGVPTSYPSCVPSISPSNQPTTSPTTVPTRQPLAYPTSVPSCSPSTQPTTEPTTSPTSKPSDQPTSLPTINPSCKPTNRPTITPSTQPSTVPSTQPTNQPSAQPNAIPTVVPSSQPTSLPSQTPTVQPSNAPTSIPSQQPTSFPTSQPSVVPTRQPSCSPSVSPSQQPTSYPSVFPTTQPSVIPTSYPSIVPTSLPSSAPSSQPSAEPSSEPTVFPSSLPSCQPTTLPSSFPSSLPTIIPSAVPTVQPSTQPTARPSVDPSSLPSSVPSTIPSSCPTSQPSQQPTGDPTQSPMAIPTSYPSSQPSSKPSLQPVAVPSSQPTSTPTTPSSMPTLHPTVNNTNCFTNEYYSFVQNDCVKCQNFSSSMRGSRSCSCNPGYKQVGIQDSLVCNYCREGEYSFVAGSYACTQCFAGSYSSHNGSAECTLCPVGTYSSDIGAKSKSTCKACAAGRTTPFTGATSSAQCLSPMPNFIMGAFTLVITVFVVYSYIIKDRFNFVARQRKEIVIKPVEDICDDVNKRLQSKLRERKTIRSKMSSQRKVFLFILGAIVIMVVVVICYYLLTVFNAMYTALILWRGYSFGIAVPFLDKMLESVQSLGKLLGLGQVINAIFYPLLYLFKVLSFLRLDFGQLNVTCAGSQAPIELFFDCIVLGVVVIVIKSGYQVVWSTTVHQTHQAYAHYLVTQQRNNIFSALYSLIVAGIVLVVANLNPFQIVLRYIMGFVILGTFVEENYLYHKVSEACDRIKLTPNIDSTLGYSSSLMAWWILVPVIYTVSDVLVPGCRQLVIGSLLQQWHTKETVRNRSESIKRSKITPMHSNSSSSKSMKTIDGLEIADKRLREFAKEIASAVADMTVAYILSHEHDRSRDEYVLIKFKKSIKSAIITHISNIYGRIQDVLSDDAKYALSSFVTSHAVKALARGNFIPAQHETERQFHFSAQLHDVIRDVYSDFQHYNLTPSNKIPSGLSKKQQQQHQLADKSTKQRHTEGKINSNNTNGSNVNKTVTFDNNELEQQQIQRQQDDNDEETRLPSLTNNNNSQRLPRATAFSRKQELRRFTVARDSILSDSSKASQRQKSTQFEYIRRFSLTRENGNINLNNSTHIALGLMKRQQQQQQNQQHKEKDNKPTVFINTKLDKYYISIMSTFSFDLILSKLALRWLAKLKGETQHISKIQPTIDIEEGEIVDAILESNYKLGNREEISENERKMPHYFELCELVYKEIIESSWMMRKAPFLAFILVYILHIGHFRTNIGIQHWRIVMWKYGVFMMACLGIWSNDDKLIVAYDMIHLARKGAEHNENDEVNTYIQQCNMSSVLRSIIGTRSIILQIIPVLTIVSAYSMCMSSTPTFVFSESLRGYLPDLLLTNSLQLAFEIELEEWKNIVNIGDNNNDNNDSDDDDDELGYYEWTVQLRALNLFITQSRGIQFGLNLYLFILSVGLLLGNTDFWITSSLIIIVPYGIVQSFSVLLFLARRLQIRNKDWLVVYEQFSVYHKQQQQQEQNKSSEHAANKNHNNNTMPNHTLTKNDRFSGSNASSSNMSSNSSRSSNNNNDDNNNKSVRIHKHGSRMSSAVGFENFSISDMDIGSSSESDESYSELLEGVNSNNSSDDNIDDLSFSDNDDALHTAVAQTNQSNKVFNSKMSNKLVTKTSSKQIDNSNNNNEEDDSENKSSVEYFTTLISDDNNNNNNNDNVSDDMSFNSNSSFMMSYYSSDIEQKEEEEEENND